MMDPEKISKLRIVQKEESSGLLRFRWRYVVAILFVACLAASVFLYRSGVIAPAHQVQVASATLVYPSQVIAETNASGYVVAQRRASVASKGTGRLQYLGVKEGSRVKEGEVLARLESEDIEAERAQVEAQVAAARADLVRAETELRSAERNWRRFKNLLQSQVVSQSSYESAEDQLKRARALVDSGKANVKALEAALKRSSVLLDYTEIRAPFDGVILTKDADVGEVVAPFGSSLNAKAAVVTMADPASLMVQVDVAESSLGKVREGQPCEIQLDSLPDRRFSGKVETIVPTADRTKGTVMVKVRFDRLDERILPEMSARVAFLARPLADEERKPFLGVYKDALTERKGVQGIFKVGNDRALWIPLSKVEVMGDYLLLAPPMQVDDRIVRNPSGALETGAKIKVAE